MRFGRRRYGSRPRADAFYVGHPETDSDSDDDDEYEYGPGRNSGGNSNVVPGYRFGRNLNVRPYTPNEIRRLDDWSAFLAPDDSPTYESEPDDDEDTGVDEDDEEDMENEDDEDEDEDEEDEDFGQFLRDVRRGGSNFGRKRWKSPTRTQRKRMLSKCGPNCFLQPKLLKYPICDPSCEVNKYGLEAAYKRARQWKKRGVAKKAKSMMRKYSYDKGRKRRVRGRRRRSLRKNRRSRRLR